MSNPTELPDVIAEIKALTCAAHPAGYTAKEARMFNLGFYAGTGSAAEVARRAQPEGEAPQAEPLSDAKIDRIARAYFSEQWAVQHAKDAIHDAFEDARKSASLSPLCGAQHAESGKEVAAKPPFPISDDEMAALRRFWECATDDEGYDVSKRMMQRLADMGLVQRKSGSYYMSTDFGLYVLGEYTAERAAQLDGGQGESHA